MLTLADGNSYGVTSSNYWALMSALEGLKDKG